MFNILMEPQILSGEQNVMKMTRFKNWRHMAKWERKRMKLFNCGTLDVNYQLYQRGNATKCDR